MQLNEEESLIYEKNRALNTHFIQLFAYLEAGGTEQVGIFCQMLFVMIKATKSSNIKSALWRVLAELCEEEVAKKK